jgi:hypothetical protein
VAAKHGMSVITATPALEHEAGVFALSLIAAEGQQRFRFRMSRHAGSSRCKLNHKFTARKLLEELSIPREMLVILFNGLSIHASVMLPLITLPSVAGVCD